MATLENRLIALAQALGTDVKTLTNGIGVLTTLNTTAKNNLVAAINEINLGLGNVNISALIDDLAAASVTDKTYSANKITGLIATAVTGLVSTAPGTLDTLKELADALANDPSFAATISTALGKRVRVDAVQTFTAPEQAQARDNIGAASVADLGAIDHDFVADYAAAKV